MARFRRILRLSVWWCCLLCVLSVTQVATANTRKSVSVPPPSSVASGGGSPSRTGNSLAIPGEPIQEYIPRTPGGTAGTPFKVLPRIDFSIPRTINGVKSVLKISPASLAASAAVAAMLESIDAFIDEAKDEVRVPSMITAPDDGKFYWALGDQTRRASSPKAVCEAIYMEAANGVPGSMKVEVNGSTASCTWELRPGEAGTGGYTIYRWGSECLGTYIPATGECLVEGGSRPAEEPEFQAMANFADGQNAAWLKGLLKDYCTGSNAPPRCFDEMADNSAITGPGSVAGPSSTTTGTYTKPDGTTGTTGTTNNTRYNITYGNNYYNYSSTTTTTVTKDGNVTDTSTSTDEGSPATEEPPKEDKEEEQPSPCAGSNCDGPAYTDLYEPTDETKEQHIDGYLSRISGIPIFQAVTGLFDVQVGGSCPVWEVHEVVPILGYNFTINLVFDFLCLPWIVSMGPWIRAVIYAVATGYAIRVAIL